MEAANPKTLTVLLCIILYNIHSVCCHAINIAQPCNDDICKLPDCFCSGTKIPGGLTSKDVPQMVMISFDDAVNIQNFKCYTELLNNGSSTRKNPNGKYCAEINSFELIYAMSQKQMLKVKCCCYLS